MSIRVQLGYSSGGCILPEVHLRSIRIQLRTLHVGHLGASEEYLGSAQEVTYGVHLRSISVHLRRLHAEKGGTPDEY